MKAVRVAVGVLAMVVVIAGCGNKTTGQASQTREAGAMSALTGNTLKFSASIPNFGTSPTGTLVQEEWKKRMEAYLGCTLDISWTLTPWADYRNNEQVILASGNLPDVFTYTWGNMINAYGEDGQVLDIARYRDVMSYYPRFIEGTPGKEAFAYNADGTGYYFMDGFVNDDNYTGAQSFTGFIYRFDVLQKHNLFPATTLAEFDALCARLKQLYPNLYVINNTADSYAFYRGFVGIFHTWDTLYWNGNAWAYGPVEDNFREMLRYINKLYAAGYIDPEFATDNSDLATEKATTGKNLIWTTAWAGMAGAWNDTKIDPAYIYGLAYLPQNPAYGVPWKWGSKLPGTSLPNRADGNNFGIAISARAPNPEWIVKLVDYQYSPEMVELQNWGVEGVTYTKDAGVKRFTPEILSAQNPVQALANYGVTSSAACRTGIPFTPQDFTPQVGQIREEMWWSPGDGYHMDKYWIASAKYGGPESICPTDMAPIVRLTADESTARAQLVNACDTIAKERAVKFITGELSLDKDWDSYVNAIRYAVDDFQGTLDMLNTNTVR
ncbi:MAG: hypothetical protein LBF95_01840 [Treponema sp.]|jgi:ABC-type glycerol-3-phosphate transport system substrate-binding protein|nr:hypothetical protein [Treponema sp.]